MKKTVSSIDKTFLFHGINTVETQECSHKESATSKATICCWFAKFTRGRTDTNIIRSGRPNEVVTLNNFKKSHKIVLNNF